MVKRCKGQVDFLDILDDGPGAAVGRMRCRVVSVRGVSKAVTVARMLEPSSEVRRARDREPDSR